MASVTVPVPWGTAAARAPLETWARHPFLTTHPGPASEPRWALERPAGTRAEPVLRCGVVLSEVFQYQRWGFTLSVQWKHSSWQLFNANKLILWHVQM